MISQPPYVWSHIQYTCDILSTIFMISYPLCMTTQHSVWLIPHSAYVWHHLHFRCYHIHSITPNHSIYDVTSTSGMISQPLYQTSHPLYLRHHNLSTDIIPTFVWYHTHYMDEIICTLHNIISTTYVITLLYLWHHSLYIWNHIQYVGPHIHCTCDITATNLCHHSHSIENITHAVYDIRLVRCMASFALYRTSHPRFMTSNHHFYDITPTIFDIVSNVSVSSPPMYWWYHTDWIIEISSAIYDNIISIVYDITALNVCHHTHSFNDITPFVYRTSHPLYV